MTRGPTTAFRYALTILLIALCIKSAVSYIGAEREKRRVKAAVTMKREPPPVITVEIGGAIRKRGVYSLKSGSRLYEAVTAAGGFRENADTGALNLSASLKDGDKIVIPAIAGEESGYKTATQTYQRSEKKILPEGWKININKAAAADFEKIPGIGPALASRVIDLRRTRGPYASIEEIKLVKGIGDFKYDNIKQYLTVEN